MAYTKPQQWKKEESQRLQEHELRPCLSILDLKECKLQDTGKEEGKICHELHIVGLNDNLWDRVCGLGSKI